MTAPEEAVFVRPAADGIRLRWKQVFADPLLSLARLKSHALSRSGLGEEDSDGGITLRSVYWRFYHGLLPPPTSPNLFAPTLETSRATYTTLRRRYLIAPDGRWASDCSPGDDIQSSPNLGAGIMSTDGAWDPLSLDGQSPWKTWFAHQDLRATIRQDVDRTFPDIDYFKIERVRRMMVTMLFLFAVLNPDVGYRQGMHELLAVCLLSVDRDSLDRNQNTREQPSSSAQAQMLEAMQATLDRRYIEHDSYELFQALMKGAKAFYEWRAEEGPRTKSPNAPQAPIIIRCQHLHNSLLRRIDPQLWEQFETEGLEPQIWAIRWIRLIFTRELPFAVALRSWDGIFAEDPSLALIDYVCVAMLLLIRNELLEADYSTLLSKLLRYPAPSADYPLSPHLLLSQALMLRSNVSPAGGVEVIMQNQEILGVRAEPPERVDSDDRPRRGGNAGSSSARRAPMPPTARAGMQGIAQGLFERAQAAGLDKTFYSTVADIRKNLPESYASYIPNLPFSPLGTSSPRQASQFSSIPSSSTALPSRSGFFSPLHAPASAHYSSSRPPAMTKVSSDSDISIRSLRDAERDMAELRLAMVGMGKAMNEWMAALPVVPEVARSDAWDGLGRVRDTLLDAAGKEVEDMAKMWGWHEGLEAPRNRDEPVPDRVTAAVRHQMPTSDGMKAGTTAPNERTPTAPDVAKMPETPRPPPSRPLSASTSAEPTKPVLNLSNRNDRPITGLPRTPLTAPPGGSSSQSAQAARRDPLTSAGTMDRSDTVGTKSDVSSIDPLAGLNMSSDPLGGVQIDKGFHSAVHRPRNG